MKRKSIIAGALLIGTMLTACGTGKSGSYEKLNQTGTLADYSSCVSLGNYKGIEVGVNAYEITDEDVATLIDDILFNYYSVSSTGDTINYVWDDETAAKISGGKYTTTASYEKFRREGMEAELEAQQQLEYVDGIWEEIMKNSTFTGIDENQMKEAAEEYYATQKANYEYYATYYGYEYEEYLQEKQGMSDEEFHDKCYEYVLTEKQRVMASSAIFYAEGLTFTDEEFSKGVAELMNTYTGYESAAEFVETFGEDYVREYLISKKVDDYLKKENTMSVK